MEEFEARINELRGKERAALTEADLEFLKARQSYLTGEERAKFDLQEQQPEQPAEEQGKEGEEDAPAKTPKKTKKQPAEEPSEEPAA